MIKLPKLRKIENLLIQLAIFLATYLFIYKQVFHNSNLPELIQTVKNDVAKPEIQLLFPVILLMMALNWCLEAVKWQYLIGTIFVFRLQFFRKPV